MPRRILLVEDDVRIRRVLSLSLRAEGFELEEAGTGAHALELLSERTYDVVVLDVMLPDTDGFEVCRTLRHSSTMPVIMVTARTDSHDVVAGLEAGADDYVTKPLVAKELSARIRALLRRSHAVSVPTRIDLGDVEISPSEGLVVRAGTSIDLTRTEFRLLCELASSPGRIFSREELLERVWGYGYFGDSRLVDVHVRRLRSKVEPDPANPTLVLTARGRGYRLPA